MCIPEAYHCLLRNGKICLSASPVVASHVAVSSQAVGNLNGLHWTFFRDQSEIMVGHANGTPKSGILSTKG